MDLKDSIPSEEEVVDHLSEPDHPLEVSEDLVEWEEVWEEEDLLVDLQSSMISSELLEEVEEDLDKEEQVSQVLQEEMMLKFQFHSLSKKLVEELIEQ